ncbi:hypothetical protein V6N13_130036 [Hibiscus sabdariffa]
MHDRLLHILGVAEVSYLGIYHRMPQILSKNKQASMEIVTESGITSVQIQSDFGYFSLGNVRDAQVENKASVEVFNAPWGSCERVHLLDNYTAYDNTSLWCGDLMHENEPTWDIAKVNQLFTGP